MGVQPKIETVMVSFDARREQSPWRAVGWLLLSLALLVLTFTIGFFFFDSELSAALPLAALGSVFCGVGCVRGVQGLMAARSITAFDAQVQQIAPRRLALDLHVTTDRSLLEIHVDLMVEFVSRTYSNVDGETESRHTEVVSPGEHPPVMGRQFVGRYELDLANPGYYGWSHSSKNSEHNWFVRVRIMILDRPAYVRNIPLWVEPVVTENSDSDLTLGMGEPCD